MRDKISIVIPCYNEEKYVERSLLSLVRSDYEQALVEIIIIDGGSTDRSLTIINDYLTQYPNIKVIDNPKKITPVSLNIGVHNATGEYIMIASAHAQFPPDYLSTLMLYLKQMKCDCIGGGIDTRIINSTPVSEAIVKILSSPFGVGNSSFRTEKGPVIYVDTVPFGIYKKSLFEEVGYYNEQLVRNHDIELSKRLIQNGRKIVLVSSVRCTYFAREDFMKFAENNFSNGVWNIITFFITKQLRSLSPRHFVPLIFILSLIIPAILSLLIDRNFIVISLLSFLLYATFIISASFRIRDKSAKFIYVLWGLIVLHFSYGIGSLAGLFKINKLFVH